MGTPTGDEMMGGMDTDTGDETVLGDEDLDEET
jgi:hypothetical protein